MPHSFLQVIIPIFGLVINVLMQIISFRFSGLGLLRSILFGFVIGLFAVFAIELYLFFKISIVMKIFLPVLTTNLIMYSSLGYCYFHFINLGETARRVRMLRELYNSREGLSSEEILERYNAKSIVEMRINRLLNNNQIICKNDRYYIGNPTVLLMAKIILVMKIIILGKKSEFD